LDGREAAGDPARAADVSVGCAGVSISWQYWHLIADSLISLAQKGQVFIGMVGAGPEADGG
jgi:hypothetical protein